MAIPKDILRVKRPTNTVVKITRTPNVYSVVKRTSKRVEGKKNPVPIEIGVIGKIVNGVYVALPTKQEYEVDLKEYGTFALCDLVGASIFRDLLKYYTVEDARKIYCIALLRVITPNIVNEDISLQYKTSYISEVYPNTALSSNTISTFLDRIGKQLCTIDEFMNDRIRKYSGNPTVIDGMLKNNTSLTNIYSEFSRKGRVKGVEDINLIYAYDLKQKEPIAFSAFPGNMLDFTAFRSFILEHPIDNGFLIMDKGFDDNVSKEELCKLNTKYLIPIKTSSNLIKQHGLDKDYDCFFNYEEDKIRSKKVEINGKFYYAFKSANMESQQRLGNITRGFDKGNFSEEKYGKKESRFGLIVFESNADFELIHIYNAYSERWKIETVFNNYKNIIDRKEVNVHGNYRLFASEFINFLSSIISLRIKKLMDETGVSSQYTERKVMMLLSKWQKRRANRNADKWQDCGYLKYIKELCKKLGV